MAKPRETETDYASEMNQPVHRPGMERAVNRGVDIPAPARHETPSPPNDPRDRNGDRIGPRREVGAATPAIQDKMLDQALDDEPPVKSAPSPPESPDAGPEAGSGEAGRAHEAQIMDYVGKAAG